MGNRRGQLPRSDEADFVTPERTKPAVTTAADAACTSAQQRVPAFCFARTLALLCVYPRAIGRLSYLRPRGRVWVLLACAWRLVAAVSAGRRLVARMAGADVQRRISMRGRDVCAAGPTQSNATTKQPDDRDSDRAEGNRRKGNGDARLRSAKYGARPRLCFAVPAFLRASNPSQGLLSVATVSFRVW